MDLIEIGASFDWITPVLKIGQDIAHGGGHTFAVPADCGWSCNDICKKLLRPANIKTWGSMVVSDTILFTTRKQDAAQAQTILQQNGISIESKEPKGYEPTSRPTGKRSDRRTRNEIATSLSRMKARSKGEPYQPGKGWSLFK